MKKHIPALAILSMALCTSGHAQESFSYPILDEIVDAYRKSYMSASTDFQRDAQRGLRKEAVCALGTTKVAYWQGIVENVESSSDGSAGLTVAMGKFTLRSYAGPNGGSTAIKRGTAMHTALLTINKGDSIAFHGSFFPGKSDCFAETSFFESNSMKAPEFVFEFTAVTKFDPRDRR